MRAAKNYSFLLILCIVVLLTVFWQGCKSGGSDDVETPAVPPQIALFESSGHADANSEAFTNWDEDNPPVVPTMCARCHSKNGFIDFADNGVVDAAAQPGVFDCDVCHTNSTTGATRTFASVTFPSGVVIGNLGAEALCMLCHLGRASKVTIDGVIASAGVGNDTPSSLLTFTNIHNLVAATTTHGTLVKGGYQYSGRSYDAKYGHHADYDRCIDCHDSHSLRIKTNNCGSCHASSSAGTKAMSTGGLYNIRYVGSLTDYDGDGDTSEGIYYEIEGIQTKLYSAILAYSRNEVGVPIGYDEYTYPYFFTDSNSNGVLDDTEVDYSNRYKEFTPRLLKACYNYHFSTRDKGAFAHGGKYLIQLLYDALYDVNYMIGWAVSMKGMQRTDEGHFDGSSEAFRYWDDDGEVPSSCARCHALGGLAYFLNNGDNVNASISNGMICTNCHSTASTVYKVDDVTFPSGEIANLADSSNICLNCHQGRASKFTVDSAMAASPGPYSFINIHYYPVAAVLFGYEVHGGYEYTGKIYAGRTSFPNHDGGKFDTCVECHMGSMGPEANRSHNVSRPDPANCVNCHGHDVSQPYPGADPKKFFFSGIRPASIPDYDADGNTSESLKAEIQGLESALYASIQAYGFAIGKPVVYDSNTYPYFFNDSNGNGLVNPGEPIYANRYSFDAKMLKAAYNYQMTRKEPHGYIHNSQYIAQLLVDSIENLGGNVAPYTWR
jgi:hypothetical protein